MTAPNDSSLLPADWTRDMQDLEHLRQDLRVALGVSDEVLDPETWSELRMALGEGRAFDAKKLRVALGLHSDQLQGFVYEYCPVSQRKRLVPVAPVQVGALAKKEWRNLETLIYATGQLASNPSHPHEVSKNWNQLESALRANYLDKIDGIARVPRAPQAEAFRRHEKHPSSGVQSFQIGRAQAEQETRRHQQQQQQNLPQRHQAVPQSVHAGTSATQRPLPTTGLQRFPGAPLPNNGGAYNRPLQAVARQQAPVSTSIPALSARGRQEMPGPQGLPLAQGFTAPTNSSTLFGRELNRLPEGATTSLSNHDRVRFGLEVRTLSLAGAASMAETPPISFRSATDDNPTPSMASTLARLEAVGLGPHLQPLLASEQQLWGLRAN